MKLILTMLFLLVSTVSFAQESLIFPKAQARLDVHWTQGPFVVRESFVKLTLSDLRTGKTLAGDHVLTMTITPVDLKIKAPKTEAHKDYVRAGQFQVSRIFFTAGGKWKVSFVLESKSQKTREVSSFEILVKNQNVFPKDTETFPYAGVKAHGKVGILGGTGCRRRWDFVDTHDSTSVNMPYDLCGKYSMVSGRYQKWIDLSVYGDHSEKVNIWPIKGDGVLEVAECRNRRGETWKLVHHPVCGDEGKTIAYCDRAGNAVTCDEI